MSISFTVSGKGQCVLKWQHTHLKILHRGNPSETALRGQARGAQLLILILSELGKNHLFLCAFMCFSLSCPPIQILFPSAH